MHNKMICYIASAKTKRDRPIRGHVTLDKCNVSLGQQVKNCCPAENVKNKMAAKLASLNEINNKPEKYTTDRKISH